MSTDHHEDPFGIRDPEDGDPFPPVPMWVRAFLGAAAAAVVGTFWLAVVSMW